MFIIRVDRDYCIEEGFMKAARKIKLESKLDYDKSANWTTKNWTTINPQV